MMKKIEDNLYHDDITYLLYYNSCPVYVINKDRYEPATLYDVARVTKLGLKFEFKEIMLQLREDDHLLVQYKAYIGEVK